METGPESPPQRPTGTKDQSQAASRDPRRSGFRGAVVAGGVTLVIVALVFTNAFGAARSAEDGLVAHSASTAIGASLLTVKALSQATLLAEDRALGTADTAIVDIAVREAQTTLEELEQSVSDLDTAIGGGSSYRTEAASALDSGAEVLAHIERGDIVAASALLAGPTREHIVRLRDMLMSERRTRVDALGSVDGIAGLVAAAAVFLAVLLLPVAAILAYRTAARRQLRVAEVQLDTRLEAEQEVGRAKDEFIANMSHELRTPLTSIYGFSELLLETGLVDPDSAMSLIEMINQESSELGRMVDDLLISARAEAGAQFFAEERVNVRDEVEVVLAPMARGRDTLEVDIADVVIVADPLRFRQIVRNLVSNALRYGGESVRILGEVCEDEFRLVVADNGEGIPTELQPRLFTRFIHDGDQPLLVGSVGLGLAVVRALAEGMQGSVSFERTSGWTRFIVNLPVPNVDSPPDATQPVEDLLRSLEVDHGDASPPGAADVVVDHAG